MGYQIIELPLVNQLIEKQATLDFQLYLFLWIIKKVSSDPEIKKLPIALNLLKVNYYGDYPAIGVQYLRSPDLVIELENLIIQKTKVLLQNVPIYEFLEFLIQEREFIINEIRTSKKSPFTV